MSPLFRYLMRYLVALVLACMVFVWAIEAQAATVTVNCVAPTQNEDGSALTDIAYFDFYRGTSATSLSFLEARPTCSQSFTVPDPAAGTSVTYYFAARTVTRPRAPTNLPIESVSSAVVSKIVRGPALPPSPPKPPVLSVVEPVAYREDNGSYGKVAHVATGSVLLGSECSPDYVSEVKGVRLNLLKDPKRATISGSIPKQIWVKCG